MGKEDRFGMGGREALTGDEKRRKEEEDGERERKREEEVGGTLGAAKRERRGERLSECLHCLHAGKQAVNTQRQEGTHKN